MKGSVLSRFAPSALIALLAVPGYVQAQEPVEKPSLMAMTGDLLLARPLGLVTTVAGSAVFLVSLPFTAAGGNIGEAGEVLVVGPARTTFARCLGCRQPRPTHTEESTH